MTVLILVLGALLTLPLIAIGLPGSWLFLAGVCIWKTFDATASVSWTAVFIAMTLAFVAELIEWGLASRYTTKYGGSPRAGWGALIGGIAGAIVGVPIPVVGSIIGSFAGAFLGALIAEYSVHQRHADVGRVAWGALVGRGMATAIKVGLGVVIAVVIIISAQR